MIVDDVIEKAEKIIELAREDNSDALYMYLADARLLQVLRLLEEREVEGGCAREI